MKNILYAHGGSKNHGCEAIVRTTQKILGLGEDMYLFSKAISEDLAILGNNFCRYGNGDYKPQKLSWEYFCFVIKYRYFNDMNAYAHLSGKLLREEIAPGDTAISIGGDNYCYDGVPQVLGYWNSCAKQQGAKTVLWGCSVEPELLKEPSLIDDLKNYDLITARESITYNALLKAGVNRNTQLFPDPAFTLEKITLDLPLALREKDIVGINVSPLVQSLEHGNNLTLENFRHLIKHIIDTTQLQIALIPHVVWQNNNDMEPLSQLFNEYSHTGRVVLIGDYNCMELKGFIARCRFFIGSRTHATIAAYSTCVPTLTLGYSVKAKGIAQDIFGSYDNYVIPVQSLTSPSDLTAAFERLQANEHNIRQHLERFMPGYIAKAWAAGQQFRKLQEK